MHVDARRGLLHRGDDVEVGLTGKRRMDAALQANLGRPPLPGLPGPHPDFVEREQVAGSAQAPRAATLREGAEAAVISADVRVVDVAIDDITHAVAHDLAAK